MNLTFEVFLHLFLVGSCAGLASFFLAPRVRNWALRRGWVDEPGGRKIHRHGVPRIGGLAVFVGAMLPLVSIFLWGETEIGNIAPDVPKVLALLAAGGAVWMLGLYDDIYGATAWQKFAVQAVGAFFLYTKGLRIELVTNPLGPEFSLGFLSLPVTVIWIVGVSNAFNLIDGIDGLAAGVGMFTAGTLAVIAGLNGRVLVSVVSVALAGSLLGFLRMNFNPARIFMGDSGSLFVGFVLGALAILGSQKGTTAVAILVPLIAMGLPLMDTFIAMARRFIQGKGVFQADRHHIHHRLLAHGFTQKRAALFLYAFTVLLGLAALGVTVSNGSVGLILALLVGGAATAVARELGYIDLGPVMGRIRSGNKRRRSPRYKNLYVRKLPRMLQEVRDLGDLKRVLLEIQEELELDLVRLSLNPLVEGNPAVNGTFECCSAVGNGKGRSERIILLAKDLWAVSVPLSGRGQILGELVIGKAAWKRRRRGEEDEEWAQKIGEGLSGWLYTYSNLDARARIHFLKELRSWPGQWVA